MFVSLAQLFQRHPNSRRTTTKKLQLETLEELVVPSTILLDNAAIDENRWGGSLVGTFTPQIPGQSSRTWVVFASGAGDTNNNLFYIANKQLRTRVPFNFEAQSTYSIRVEARTSNGLSSQESFTIQVNDVNERPSLPVLANRTVDENSAGGTLVGTLSATDPDAGDTQTFTLTNDAGGRFQINGDRLEVASGANLNFEQQQNFFIRVRVTDNGGLWRERGYQVLVRNVNEQPSAPTLQGTTVGENSPAGTYIGYASATDPDWGGQPAISLVDDAGGRFRMNCHHLVVNDPSGLNFEAATSHQITLRATDAGGLFADQTFTIQVTNRNEAPTDISLSNDSITLPLPGGSLVGQLSANDPDVGDSIQFILTNNAGGKFQVNGDRLEISNPDLFKWDPHPTYQIRVLALDAGGAGFAKTFTINVGNAGQNPPNQPPNNIAITGNTVWENSAGGTYVAYVSATDSDSWVAPAVSLLDDAGGRFELDGNHLLVKSSADLNFESASSHQITIRATDAGGL